MQGGAPARPRVDQLGGVEIATFTYWAWGLRGSVADEWVDRSPLAAALAALMRSQGDRADQKLQCLAAVGRAGLDEARECLLVDVVETYLTLNQTERTRYAEKAARTPEVTAMKSWAEKLESKGLKQGRAEGARAVLRRLLEQRFGEVPEVAVRRLEKVKDVAELERLVDRALAAGSLGELGLVG